MVAHGGCKRAQTPSSQGVLPVNTRKQSDRNHQLPLILPFLEHPPYHQWPRQNPTAYYHFTQHYYCDKAKQPLMQVRLCPIFTAPLQFDLHHVNRGQKQASGPKRYTLRLSHLLYVLWSKFLGQGIVYKSTHLNRKGGTRSTA